MENMKEWLKNNYLKVIIIVVGVFALIGLFLPYERSIGEYRKLLEENPDIVNVSEVDFKNSDVIDISIMENFKIYQYGLDNSGGNDWLYGESLVNVILTITLIISTVLVILFALFNKKVLTIIFDIILLISSLIMNYDIVSRGVIPSTKYTYGISYYLYVVVALIILICTIMLIIKKKKGNKEETTVKRDKKTNNKAEAKKSSPKLLDKIKEGNNIIYVSIGAVIIVILLLCILIPNGSSNKNDDTDSGSTNTKPEATATSKPEATATSKPNNDSPEVSEQNIEYTCTTTSDGEIILIGKNNNDGVVDVEFEIEFYDKADILVGSQKRYLDATSKDSTFALDFWNVPESYESYKVFVEVDDTDDESFTNILKATQSDNGERIVVQVSNTTDKDIDHIGVAVVYYKDNKIVGYDDSTDSDIKIGRSANFSFYYPYDNNWDDIEFDNVEVFINEAFIYVY